MSKVLKARAKVKFYTDATITKHKVTRQNSLMREIGLNKACTTASGSFLLDFTASRLLDITASEALYQLAAGMLPGMDIYYLIIVC